MKTKRNPSYRASVVQTSNLKRPRTALAASIGLLLASSAATFAQTLTWDPNTTLTGAQGGSGDWDGGNFWWNGTTNVAWTSGASAEFYTSSSVPGGSVDVSGIVVDDLKVVRIYGPYTFFSTGGTLTFAGGNGTHVLTAFTGGLNISATIAGTEGLSIAAVASGYDGVTFSGNNIYSGTTRILDAGVLNAANAGAIPSTSTVQLDTALSEFRMQVSGTIGGLTGSGLVTVGASTQLLIGANNLSSTFSGSITGGGSVSKVGTGTLTLTTGHNFSGLTTVAGGTLAVSGGDSIPQGVSVGVAGTLQLLADETVSSLDGSGVVSIGNNSLFVGSGTFSGEINGGGAVVKNTSGTLTLSGANSFSGGLSISGGTLAATDFAPLGTGDIILNGVQLSFNGASFSSNRALALVGGGTVGVANSLTNATLDGPISGTGTLSKAGAGMLTLGNSANAFSGDVSISAGKLSVSNVTNAGIAGPLGSGSSISISGGTLRIAGASSTSTNRAFSLSGTAGIEIESAAATLELRGGVSGGFTKLGPGSLLLSGTNSGSSASIIISEGALIAAGGAAIPDTASLAVATGATFRLQSTETIATLSGTGGVELSGNSLSLGLIGFSAPARTFAGVISGTGSLTTVAGVTQTLTGPNTYSGGTNIFGGTVNVPDFNSLGSGPVTVGGATTVGALGVTGATASTSQPIQIGIAGANFNSGSGTSVALNGVVSGSGPVTFRGPGTWTLGSSANSFTGATTLLGIVSVPTLTDSGVNGPLGAGNLVAIADSSTAGRLKLEGVGNFSTNRSLVLGSAGATIDVSSGAIMSANSVASGNGSLFKAGAGTLVLNAANTFTGSTSISAGTLAASGGNAIPDLSRVDISAGGTLQILASETVAKLSGSGNADIATGSLTVGGNGESSAFAGIVSGSGALVKTGAGTLTLSGANTFSGGTTISVGTISVPNLAALGTGGLRIDGALSYTGPTATDGRNLEFGGTTALISSNAGSVLTLTGAATGTGGLRYNGSGTLELTNVTNSFSGDVRISGGVLSTTYIADVGASSGLGIGNSIFLSGGTLRYTGVDSSSNRQLIYEASGSPIDIAGGVSLTLNRAQGAGGLNKIGAGTLIQTDPANSFTGAVTISAGKLVTGTLQNSGIDSALGRNSTIALNGGELALLAGAGGTTNKSITVSSNGGVFSVSGGDVTLNGVVGGSGTLTFRGTSATAGGVTLAAATTRNAPTIIDRLKLRAASGNSLPDAYRVTFTDNSGATLSIDAAETIGSIEGGAGADAGQLILGAALTTGGDNSNTILSAAISGSGKLIKVGAGTMSLAGASTFSGGISISSGTLAVTDVNNTAVPGPLGSGDFEIGNATASVRLKYDGSASRATNRRLLLTNNGARIEVSNPLASLIWSGVLSGGPLAQLIKDGPGALRLTGSNSFSGLLQINAGTLQLLGGNAVPDGSTINLASGSALELMAGTNETIGLLQGDGDIKLGGQKLTLGGTGDSSTVNGMFSGSGGSSLEKIGGGTLTITNNLNSFSGGVFISNGAISVPSISNSGISSPLGKTGAINLGDASHTGRLTVTGSANSATDRPVQVASGGGAIEVSAPSATLALSGSISGGGTLLKLGAGRLSIVNDKTFTSTTVVGEGTLTLVGSIAGGLTVISPGIADTAGIRSTGNLSMMGGTLAPGGRGAIGAFSSTGVFLDSGTLALDFNSAAPGGYDSINVTGAVELAGAFRFDITLGFDPVDYVDSFTIVVNDGADAATLGPDTTILTDYGPRRDGEVILITSGGFSQYFEVHLGTGASNDIELLAIPEPGCATLLFCACAVLTARRRRESTLPL